MKPRARGGGPAAILCMTVSSAAFAQQFDPQTLKRLGISPEAAAYFSKTARFLPGVSRCAGGQRHGPGHDGRALQR